MLLNFEEEREKARKNFVVHQKVVMIQFDNKSIGSKDLKVGDLVLKWDKIHEGKGKHMKFQQLWLGPFLIVEKLGLGTYKLQNLEGEVDLLPSTTKFEMVLYLAISKASNLYVNKPVVFIYVLD